MVINEEKRQALIFSCENEIEQLIEDINRCDAIGNSEFLTFLQSQLERQQIALASLEAEPKAFRYAYLPTVGEEGNWHYVDSKNEASNSSGYVTQQLYTEPPVPAQKLPDDDYFSQLVRFARERAEKAMRKFPQPNYVLNKVAEESGEVIKAVIHYTEGRENWHCVESELIDNLAMLIRLVKEGDQVIGFTPPEQVTRFNGVSNG